MGGSSETWGPWDTADGCGTESLRISPYFSIRTGRPAGEPGSRGLVTRYTKKVRAARVARQRRQKRGPRAATDTAKNCERTFARPGRGKARPEPRGREAACFAARVAAVARAGLRPAAERILSPPTRAARGSDSRTPEHTHAYTFTPSLTHTLARRTVTGRCPGESRGGDPRDGARGTFCHPVGSQGPSNFPSRPFPPQLAPQSQL